MGKWCPAIPRCPQRLRTRAVWQLEQQMVTRPSQDARRIFSSIPIFLSQWLTKIAPALSSIDRFGWPSGWGWYFKKSESWSLRWSVYAKTAFTARLFPAQAFIGCVSPEVAFIRYPGCIGFGLACAWLRLVFAFRPGLSVVVCKLVLVLSSKGLYASRLDCVRIICCQI